MGRQRKRGNLMIDSRRCFWIGAAVFLLSVIVPPASSRGADPSSPILAATPTGPSQGASSTQGASTDRSPESNAPLMQGQAPDRTVGPSTGMTRGMMIVTGILLAAFIPLSMFLFGRVRRRPAG